MMMHRPRSICTLARIYVWCLYRAKLWMSCCLYDVTSSPCCINERNSREYYMLDDVYFSLKSCQRHVMIYVHVCQKPLFYFLPAYQHVGSLVSRLPLPSQWRHNERDGVSNHQHHDCLLNHLFRCRSEKTSKFRVPGLCEGNSPVIGEFPAQRASNTENVSIWRRHNEIHDSEI